MRKLTAVAIGAAFLSLACAPSLFAQPAEPATESVPAPAAKAPPSRGTTMAQVEQRFGAPVERHAAVGQPPITRWVYADFIVYFEYDHVVHAVVTRR
jgi:hypothetical protein